MADPSIHVILEDDYGERYTLDDYRIMFGDMQLGETKITRVVIQNTSRQSNNVEIECIMHPTGQVGSAEDTYDAAKLSFSDSGPFTSNKITVGNMSPNEEKYLYIQWPISPEALPGYAVFAIRVQGDVNI